MAPAGTGSTEASCESAGAVKSRVNLAISPLMQRPVAALRGALRDFNRPDLLTRNPLLNARILAGNDAAGPAELRALLSDTVGTLFASARDEKFRRALELTYFQTAPKQEIVAVGFAVSTGGSTGNSTLGTFNGRSTRFGAASVPWSNRSSLA